MACAYCGGEHDARDLCRARGMSRRRFFFLSAGAVAAAAVARYAPVDPNADWTTYASDVWFNGVKVVPNAHAKVGMLWGVNDGTYVTRYRGVARTFRLESITQPGRAPSSRP